METPTPTPIAKLSDLSNGFPALPCPLIPRTHYIDNLVSMLAGSAQIVVIEGIEGIGKTTLAAQFVHRFPETAISLFISDASAFSRSPEYLLTVLCDQIHFFFKSTRMPTELNPETYIRSARMQLLREAQSTGKTIYFVIDGLLQLSEVDPALVDLILTDYLPVGAANGFKYLLTGRRDALPERTKTAVSSTSWVPPGFSSQEVEELLGEFALDKELVRDVAFEVAGNPGKVQALRRLLLNGLTPSELRTRLPEIVGKLHELEWRNAVATGSTLRTNILAMIAHAQHDVSSRLIAQSLGHSEDDVFNAVKGIGFIVADQVSSIIRFVSHPFKQFAALKLRDLADVSINRLASALTTDLGSASNLQQLPTYLALLNRGDEMLTLLNGPALVGAFKTSKSLRAVLKALSACVDYAAKNYNCPGTLRVAAQYGVVSDLISQSFVESEVLACVALGEYEKGLVLVQGALSTEDRLEGLSLIAMHVDASNSAIALPLSEEIKLLVPQADLSLAPDRAVRIGSNLIHLLPELAITLVETATSGDSPIPTDVAMAALTIAATDVRRDHETVAVSSESLSSRIKNPTIRSLTRGVALMVGRFSVEELLRRCEECESAKDCLYLLERWTARNRHHEEAFAIVKYALDRMVRASEMTIDCSTVRRLMMPLPFIADRSSFEANSLLKTVDAQKAMLQRNGPTMEYARIQLLSAEAECVWDWSAAQNRIDELFLLLLDSETESQLEALTWMVSSISSARSQALQLVSDTTRAAILVEWETVVDSMLLSTADHYEVLKQSVQALADVNPDLALALASKANTQARRDALLKELLLTRDHEDLISLGAAKVLELLLKISDENSRDEALSHVLTSLNTKELTAVDSSWISILRKAMEIRRGPWKAMSCASAIAVCQRVAPPDLGDIAILLKGELEKAYNSINSDWDRLDLGFSLVETLSVASTENARTIFKTAHQLKDSTKIYNGHLAQQIGLAIELCVASFIGLLMRKIEVDASLLTLRRLIKEIPSDGERARVWSDLALRAVAVGCKDFGTQIVRDEVRPMLSRITDEGYYEFVTIKCAAALYCTQPLSAKQLLSSLSDGGKLKAYEKIAYFKLGKTASDDLSCPIVTESLSMEDVEECLDVLSYIQDDQTFSVISEKLSDYLLSERGKTQITRNQRSQIAKKLRELGSAILPWKFGIQHRGYSILQDVFACALEEKGRSDWERLEKDAINISNMSDRVYVLAMIAQRVPAKWDDLRRTMIRSAQQLAGQILSVFDRLERLRFLAECSRKFDEGFAKLCLSDAYSLSKSLMGNRARSQRAIIDIAYRISEEFGKKLLEEAEDDPAVLRKRYVKRGVEVSEVLRRLPKEKPEDVLSTLDLDGTVELCRAMRKGLRTGSVATLPERYVARVIEKLRNAPLEERYEGFKWVVENSTSGYAKTPHGTTHLAEMFRASIDACELLLLFLDCQKASAEGRSPDYPLDLSVHGSEMIEPGSRQQAIESLRMWLREYKPAELIVTDPYFSPGDLELLAVILQEAPNCRVQLLIGETKNHERGSGEPFEEAYRKRWRGISAHDAPETIFIVVGLAESDGKCPIHDRWVLADEGGLRLGSSFGGLGRSRLSEVSRIDSAAVASIRSRLSAYLRYQTRDSNGARLRYSVGSL
jgi:hypothetical protein